MATLTLFMLEQPQFNYRRNLGCQFVALANYKRNIQNKSKQTNYRQYQTRTVNGRRGNHFIELAVSWFGSVVKWILGGIKGILKSFAGLDWCKLRESLTSISESLIKVKGNRDNVDENEPSDCSVPGSSSNMDDVNTEDDVEKEQENCNDCYSRCKYEYQRPDYCRDKTNLKKMTVIGDLTSTPTPPNFEIDEEFE
ncbi:uncharacterized protein LOC123292785 [Chrysoperla carnea]|uniref:uncharacterized protein LOC123292785 n=1 Tax=Chrysoperla carnea TaxID=189513 RepID=UPI001D06990B|nr:uncharacterized protein LOC123292785 [Chrysoperla carnea]